MPRTVTIEEAGARLSDLAREVSEGPGPVYLASEGEPGVVLLSTQAYESFLETLESQSDEALVAAVHPAMEQALAKACRAQDLDDRLFWFVHFKHQLAQALDSARGGGPRPLKHALFVLSESLERAYAEDLEPHQFEAIEECVRDLANPEIDLDAVATISSRLREVGLDYLPEVTFPETPVSRR